MSAVLCVTVAGATLEKQAVHQLQDLKEHRWNLGHLEKF